MNLNKSRATAEAIKWLSLWNWKTIPGMRILTDKELYDLMLNAYVTGFTEANRIEALKKNQSSSKIL